MSAKKRILSGMRPTGKLHIGHLVGALNNWVKLQDEYECFFVVVDWHALMSEYTNAKAIYENGVDNAIDWISCGIDYKKSAVFVQSDVQEHLELNMILSCITPLGWLKRCPTYKEQLKEIKDRDLETYAFLGYPVLQAADILLYRATTVPVGEDQLPHLELTREIARRFNHLYKAKLPEPQALLAQMPRLLGLDGRKMSKSYHNTIDLSESHVNIKKKVQGMFTDPKRIRRNDPGHPDKCNVHSYYAVFAPGKEKEVTENCRNAKIGCTECKQMLAEELIKVLKPIQEKRKELSQERDTIKEILRDGAERARTVARATVQEVKTALFGKDEL
ncbi:tryptophan--tRNA ligase [Candidatus Omnitrophota bacterium]